MRGLILFMAFILWAPPALCRSVVASRRGETLDFLVVPSDPTASPITVASMSSLGLTLNYLKESSNVNTMMYLDSNGLLQKLPLTSGVLRSNNGVPGFGTLSSDDLASGSISTAKIADAAVTSAKIATGAVGSSQLASGSVSATHINSGGLLSTGLTTDSGRIALNFNVFNHYIATSTCPSSTSCTAYCSNYYFYSYKEKAVGGGCDLSSGSMLGGYPNTSSFSCRSSALTTITAHVICIRLTN